MIDAKEIIAKQLSATERAEVTLNDGSRTVLTPSRFVPQLAGESMRLTLNGPWRVARWPFKRSEAALAAPACKDASWPAVEQPGRVFYNDPEENPATVKGWNRVKLDHIDPDDGAVLRRRVKIPAAWRGKRIFLRFDAIYPGGRVYCNGRLLGEHLSGLTPAEWDVTADVRPGAEAVIALRLIRRHKHVQLDMPRHAMEFAGISQDAFLHAVEQCHAADYHLITSVGASFRFGKVAGKVWLRNTGRRERACSLKVLLHDSSGRLAASEAQRLKLGPGKIKAVPVKLVARNVMPWNDEFPCLYRVSITLDADGQKPQETTYRTGFRRLEVAGGRPTLNGNPVKFRGVNHLTHSVDGGMCTPREWLRACLRRMKQANVNAIRTHYLAPPALADLCDEMGFYLLQELPIDWGTDYVQDPDWVGPVLMRLEGGVRRDRHHPSIMVWSVGNENMPATAQAHDAFYNHLRIYDRFVKTLDPSRPTMFPPPGPAGKIRAILETRLGDIADTHYSFALAKQMRETGTITNPETWDGATSTATREEALARGWSGVWFSSEYGIFNLQPDLLNAPYNSIIADRMEDPTSGKNTQQVFIDRLREEWGLMRDDPSCLGGAYFCWIAAGAGDPWGWVRWGEDADWGIVTRDLLPKPAFWAMRVLFSPIQFPDRIAWHKGETEIAFTVTNGYNIIDLNHCTLRTMMDGGPPYMGMLREWKDIPASCAPGRTATIRVPIWNPATLKTLESGSPAVCRCTLIDPNGFRPITADILVTPAG